MYEDHDELYYVYETIKNINQILELLPALELKQYSKRKIIRARNMYNEKVDKYLWSYKSSLIIKKDKSQHVYPIFNCFHL